MTISIALDTWAESLQRGYYSVKTLIKITEGIFSLRIGEVISLSVQNCKLLQYIINL